MSEIVHPLSVDVFVEANKPPCKCKGPNAPWDKTNGIIKKVISNHSGVWYFLSSGVTVKADWVTQVRER